MKVILIIFKVSKVNFDLSYFKTKFWISNIFRASYYQKCDRGKQKISILILKHIVLKKLLSADNIRHHITKQNKLLQISTKTLCNINELPLTMFKISDIEKQKKKTAYSHVFITNYIS